VVERLDQRYGEAVTRAKVSVEVDAPAEEVWKVVSDPRNLPRWDRHIVAVEDVPTDGLKKGSGYSTVLRFMGMKGRVRTEVLELDPPRCARMQLKGIIDAVVETTVTPLGNSRSRLEHEVDYRFGGGAVGALAAQAVRLTGGPHIALRKGTLAQKRQVEGG
jgi:uncharacterized protein YndB with AHSA1/START domain